MAESSKIIVFSRTTPPRAGYVKLKGIQGSWVFDSKGQCYVDNTERNLKIISNNHLRFWEPPEELTEEEMRLSHWERYETERRRKERQREREEEWG